MHDYLLPLNEPQREAVLYTEGPLMIVAGALLGANLNSGTKQIGWPFEFISYSTDVAGDRSGDLSWDEILPDTTKARRGQKAPGPFQRPWNCGWCRRVIRNLKRC